MNIWDIFLFIFISYNVKKSKLGTRWSYYSFFIKFKAFVLTNIPLPCTCEFMLRHWKWWGGIYHTIMHNLVPVFPCDDSEQYSNGFASWRKIGMPNLIKQNGDCMSCHRHEAIWVVTTKQLGCQVIVIKAWSLLLAVWLLDNPALTKSPVYWISFWTTEWALATKKWFLPLLGHRRKLRLYQINHLPARHLHVFCYIRTF